MKVSDWEIEVKIGLLEKEISVIRMVIDLDKRHDVLFARAFHVFV